MIDDEQEDLEVEMHVQECADAIENIERGQTGWINGIWIKILSVTLCLWPARGCK
jgi:hypothetical protein